MPASLFTTGATVPQRARCLDEQTRARVEIAGVSKHQGVVMGFYGGNIVRIAVRVEPVGVRNQPNGRQWDPTVGPVQGPQDEPPRGQPVRTAFRWADHAFVRTAAQSGGQPLLQGA